MSRVYRFNNLVYYLAIFGLKKKLQVGTVETLTKPVEKSDQFIGFFHFTTTDKGLPKFLN